MKKQTALTLLGATALLVTGLLPYVFCRQEVWFLQPFASLLPEPVDPGGGVFGRFFRNHLSDGAWYASFLLIQKAFGSFGRRLSALDLLWFALPFILEFGQLAGLVPGTFDWLDIIVYLIITIIFFAEWKIRQTRPRRSCSAE